MIELLNTGAYLVNGIDIIPDTEEGRAELKARTGAVPCPADAAKETIAYGILKDHNVSGNMENLQIKFDKLTQFYIITPPPRKIAPAYNPTCCPGVTALIFSSNTTLTVFLSCGYTVHGCSVCL